MRGRQAGGSRLPFFTWQIYLAEGTQVNHERQAGWRVKVPLLPSGKVKQGRHFSLSFTISIYIYSSTET
jgi:hypothetical protein